MADPASVTAERLYLWALNYAVAAPWLPFQARADEGCWSLERKYPHALSRRVTIRSEGEAILVECCVLGQDRGDGDDPLHDVSDWPFIRACRLVTGFLDRDRRVYEEARYGTGQEVHGQ